MAITEHGFKQGFISALNRCVATSFFTAPPEPGKPTKNQPADEVAPQIPKILGQEQYLAIPTFIRQGKTLTL